jgi:hypothetical protein
LSTTDATQIIGGRDVENKDKIILDLCGGTGSWSKPYKDAGYDVRVITLPEYDVREWTGIPDIMGCICQNITIYGILAAPPCTMFSLARTRARTERDFREGMECVRACMAIIWEARTRPLYRKDGALKFWALENPVGFLRQFLGKPAMTFNPCDFGDPYTKKTDLWGYFNEPKKSPVKLSKEEEACKINNRKLPSIADFTGSKQSARRAMTPPGFAKAFFKANQ